MPALCGCMPADEYTFGNAAASFAPSCESSTSVPTLTTASTPSSAAPATATSGDTFSRRRCVCESTNINPLPRQGPHHNLVQDRRRVPLPLSFLHLQGPLV